MTAGNALGPPRPVRGVTGDATRPGGEASGGPDDDAVAASMRTARRETLLLVDRWRRTDRLSAVRRRLAWLLYGSVVAFFLALFLPTPGTVASLVLTGALLLALVGPVAAYTMRRALADRDAVREASTGSLAPVSLGVRLLGGFARVARRDRWARAGWQVLFGEPGPDGERRPGVGADRARRVAGYAAVAVVVAVVLEWVAVALRGAVPGAPTLPVDVGGVLVASGAVAAVALVIRED